MTHFPTFIDNEIITRNVLVMEGSRRSLLDSDFARSPSPAVARLTFIIPAYNAEQTIERTLRSLADQTCPGWQAIVVDDGSTDATREIAALWAARDARFRVLPQDHKGVSAARNLGVSAASSEYLTFLDADDTVHPQYVRRMLRAIRSVPGVEAVCCGSYRLSVSGRTIERSAAPRLDMDPAGLCRRHPPAPLHALMVRRRRVLEAGGFDPTLHAFEDWDLWLHLVRLGVRFAVERKRLALYWRSEHSLTSNGAQMMTAYQRVATRAGGLLDGETAGRQPSDQELRLETALWNSGMAIGSGQPAAPTLEALSGGAGLAGDKHALASAFLRGLSIGCQCRPSEFIHHWTLLAPRIAEFLEMLEHRLGEPGAAYALTKELERATIRGDFGGTMVLTRTTGVMVGPACLLHGVQVTSQVDSIMFRLPWNRAVLETPAWGALSGAQARHLLLRRGWQRLLRSVSLNEIIPEAMRLADRPLRPAIRFARRLLLRRGAPSAVPEAPPAPIPAALASLDGRLGRIMADARSEALADAAAVAARPPAAGRHEPYRLHGDALVQAWDEFFQTADPWNYDSDYERIKYERTLAMIPDGPVGCALELACAEGRFTRRLAPRAQRLRAVDISRVALERAAERCRQFDNIDYVASNFFVDPIEGQWDLITGSEVIYYMDDDSQLADLAARICAALKPGGYFVHAHGFDVSKSPHRTGFDWGLPFDAQQIFEAFKATPGLQHRRELVTELYRIDLFQKSDAAAPAVIEQASIDCKLEPNVARFVIWNGPVARRSDVERERAYRVPVLMYHRVAEDGPAALAPYRVSASKLEHQLRFLRRRGFRSVSVDEWQAAHRRGSLIGRPVLLTFDDAYVDFYETAWPLLRAYDFQAHVFVPTGHVGGAATWDAAYGPPAPLMSWDMIAELASQGVTFGSHLVSHRRSDCLTSEELLREAVRSKIELEQVLRTPVTTIAAPFGISDHRAEQVFDIAGYRQGFLDGGGPARVFGLQMATKRIEIAGSDDIETFAIKVGMTAYPPERGDEV